MKVSSSLVAVCAALATLAFTPQISATPIRIIDASSLIGTPFDPNPHPPPSHPHPHPHAHSHAHGVPVKLDEEAEKSVKGWMDFFEKYALGVSGMKKGGAGDGEMRYGGWREGKVVGPWDKTGPGYQHKAKTQIEDKLPKGHHHHHNYHPEGESEAFYILPHNSDPKPNLPSWLLSPLSSLGSNTLPTIIKPKPHPQGHNTEDGLSLPHTGVADDDWKKMLVQAGIIRPEEVDGVVVKNVYGVPADGAEGPVGVGMYRGKWYGHGVAAPGPGQGYPGAKGPSRCFFGRLTRAINSLQPLESFLISFIFGMGLASLLRIIYMIILLVKRSHQYMNEAPGATIRDGRVVVEAEGTGYPGAEARRRREREGAEEREELLPAYTEKVVEEEEGENGDQQGREQTTGQ